MTTDPFRQPAPLDYATPIPRARPSVLTIIGVLLLAAAVATALIGVLMLFTFGA